jgi:hypothetical protein
LVLDPHLVHDFGGGAVVRHPVSITPPATAEGPPLPGLSVSRYRAVSFEELKTRQLTTDRDGSVMDCYGFRRLGPVHDPLWTGPRPINVTFRTIRPMSIYLVVAR